MCAHFPCGDIEFSVAKDVIGENVCDAEDQHQDTAGDDDPPEGCAQGFLGCSLLIQVSEDGHSEDDHERTEGNETGGWGEERPICSNVIAENWKFGNN